MRRMLVLMTAALLMAACGKPASAPAGDWPMGVKEAEVYEQVLRRYLNTPADNSFRGTKFKAVFVLDRAFPHAGSPTRRKQEGVPIPAETQRLLVSALASTASVQFIADKQSVLDESDGCAKVKDGGILITLGTVDGDDNEVQVGINGFVACLGATWLTYVVKNQNGWIVTGDTGERAIA